MERLTSIIRPHSSAISETLLLLLLFFDVLQIHLKLRVLLRLFSVYSKQVPCALRDIQLDLLEDLLN